MAIQTILSAITGIITAVGVVVAVWQLWLTRNLAQSSFEDSLNKEYRSLILEIPVDVLLGQKKVLDSDFQKIRELIYNYIDLCNEQVFLRTKNRITINTWWEWAEGIRSTLGKPIFQDVWSEIKETSPEIFKELRQAEASQFKSDPKSGKKKKP